MNRFSFLITLLATSVAAAESKFESYIQKYPESIYQDLVIDDEIYAVGTDRCHERYELIKPIFNSFKRPFTVMDLGAAQGYFSFRIAKDFPESTCVMVESNHTAYYAWHGNMLYDLCAMNNHLNNIYFLDRQLSIDDLRYLNRNEHFDVIIAFLVVHLMHKNLKEQVEILKLLLQLTDNLIVEVANDVGVIHTSYVEYLSQALGAHFLGEVKRHKDVSSTSTGKLFWFQTRQDTLEKIEPIQESTFLELNGVYPESFKK